MAFGRFSLHPSYTKSHIHCSPNRYRGPYLLAFRMLVRFKLAQVAGTRDFRDVIYPTHIEMNQVGWCILKQVQGQDHSNVHTSLSSGASSLVIPGALYIQGAEISTFEMLGLGAFASGAIGCSAALWYFSRR
eukprot:5970233-Pyramimonas_sp.AAC.1